ncbi:hypothetical protein F1654_00635 [Alkalicaulis satelles]|uniref:Acetyl-CoA hydrolase/transferase C-terminal domain-containing protein n=1 Tax=Alkalicaulis satelles TaxID=2609175 RepID=A0A5M6ZQL0_9PROT|nr:acetyl-CoA hydrolase/transferase C-terminal domain-containing protein [Alkalicaulis satelles]KAA5804551.1 hypothetical protein F1654_00635 [Alkalicaulis satelles]
MTAGPDLLSPAALATYFRARLPDAARVYVPGVAGEPYVMAQAMKIDPETARGLTFFGVWIPGVNRTDWSALHDTARFETIFLAPELRAGFEVGKMIFRPLTYTQAWRWLASCPVDGAILQVAPPDREGRCSLSLSCDFTPAVWARAKVRVAQINPALPVMPGAPWIPLSAFDAVCEVESEPRGYEAGDLPEAFAAIASHIAGLVEDRAAVQFGLGKVQLAVLPALKDHKALTIHSGMVSDPLMEILDGEAVAAIRTGAVLGSRALAQRLAGDRRLMMAPVSATHEAGVLAGLARFTAINSVIEVDLFGQANAEFVGGRQISGGGGLADFLRGAQASPGGKAIVALASTAKGGTLSRIVPRLSAPAVSLGRSEVDYVVTEQGAADLSGLDLDARAQALIQIAHFDHRAMLESAWTELRRTL